MIIVILGAPGSGKGTHSKALSRLYNIPHVSTGDICRNYIMRHDEIGKKIEKYVDAGRLAPDDLIIEALIHRISERDCENGFVLDGFPRSIGQTVLLEETLKKLNKKIDLVINLDVPDEIIKERTVNRLICDTCREIYNLKDKKPLAGKICNICGAKLSIRKDDMPEVVCERLKIYHENAGSILEFYKTNNVFINIEGQDKIEETVVRIMNEINGKQ